MQQHSSILSLLLFAISLFMHTNLDAQPLILGFSNIDHVTCFGGTDGSATAQASGGAPPYTYAWSNGQMGATAINLAAGTYHVTTTDLQMQQATNMVTITQPDQLQINVLSQTDIDCMQPFGSASVSGSGGVQPYQFSWSNGGMGTLVSDLPAGVTTVTLTDANMCVTQLEVQILADTIPPLAMMAIPLPITCKDTTVQLDGTGSSTGPDITYQWTTLDGNILSGATTLTPFVNAPGLYTLQVTNTANGCVSSTSKPVMENIEVPEVMLTPPAHLTCFQPQIPIQVQQPLGPDYVFNWTTNNGIIIGDSTAPTIMVSQPGLYTVSVENTQNGCVGMASVTVMGDLMPPDLEIAFPANASFDCANDRVLISLSSQAPEPDYCLQNVPLNITECNAFGFFSIQQPGEWIATVMNPNNGCETSDTFLVQDTRDTFPFLITTIDAQPGEEKGLIEIMLDAGNPGATWTLEVTGFFPNEGFYELMGQEGNDFQVPPGAYEISAASENGCTYYEVVLVDRLPGGCNSSITLDLTPVTCLGGNDGQVDVQITSTCDIGKVRIYKRIIGPDDPIFEDACDLQQCSFTVNQLDVGAYTIIASLDGGDVWQTFDILGPTLVTHVQNPTCNDGDVIVVAQVLPASYASMAEVSFSSSPATTQDSLAPGVELFTIPVQIQGGSGNDSFVVKAAESDSNCIAEKDVSPQIFIPEPISINVEVENTDNNPEEGFLLEISCTGGTPPYSLMGEEANDVIIDTTTESTVMFYWERCSILDFSVTDAAGCTATTSATIGVVAARLEVTSPDCHGQLGAAQWTGNLDNLNFHWSTGETTPGILGLQPGEYAVTSTDAQTGCQEIRNFVIAPPDFNPFEFSTTDVPPGEEFGTITLHSIDNDIYDVFISSATGSFDTTFTLMGGSDGDNLLFPQGVYYILATNDRGCMYENVAVINAEDCDIQVRTETTPATCLGSEDGTIRVFYSGATQPVMLSMYISEDNFIDTVIIYNYASGQVIENLPAFGTGGVGVAICCICFLQDAAGCNVSFTATDDASGVVVGGPILKSMSSWDGCATDGTGFATISVVDGEEPLSYLWSTGDTTRAISGLEPGTYSVEIWDDLGCNDVVDVEVFQPDPLTIIPSVTDDGNGMTYTITLAVTGGNPPYNYTWTQNGEVIADSDTLVALPGLYSVIVVDENGCETQEDIDVVSTATQNAEDDLTVKIFPNPARGTVSVTVPPGYFPASYDVISLTGQPVQSGILNNRKTTVPIRSAAPGLYYLRVYWKDRIAGTMVVILP